tara:strand:+ start:3133 stop:3627 length:495 start_codon:yes stop_codon:yes gene_type:complete
MSKRKDIIETLDESEAYIARAMRKDGKSDEQISARLAVLRRPASVDDVIQDSDDQFAYVGDDHRPDLYRYSWVPDKGNQVERLERQDFTKCTGLDVRPRGIPGGITMMRTLEKEALYKSARAKRDYERRYGKRRVRQQWAPNHGDADGWIGDERVPMAAHGQGD